MTAVCLNNKSLAFTTYTYVYRPALLHLHAGD
jgi:hypothetical protein